MLTIGKLARKFDLSRSTLLYYDRIGLLMASGRTPSNYRMYTRSDVHRLEKICLYRQAGLDLKTIAVTLRRSNSSLAQTLEQQIDLLNQRIQTLRRQQHLIVSLLKGKKGEDLPISSNFLSCLITSSSVFSALTRSHIFECALSARGNTLLRDLIEIKNN